MRFANWLHNGQPTGPQNLSTTEDGAYFINGYSGMEGATIQRNIGWQWAVTSENEWYKAAYYKGSSANAGYWDYPTQSNTVPSNLGADGYTDPGNHANYFHDRFGYTIGSPYFRTMAGEFEKSASAYGTFDQGGNVFEWNEALPYNDSSRGLRGGAFNYSYSYLQASVGSQAYDPSHEDSSIGFRVSAVPEPSSLLALGSGILALAGMIRRRRNG